MGVKFTENDLRSKHRSFTQTFGLAIVTGPVVIFGMHMSGDGTNPAIVNIYDALIVTGTPITLKAAATGSAEFRFEPTGIRFTTGLTVENASAAGTPNVLIRYMAE